VTRDDAKGLRVSSRYGNARVHHDDDPSGSARGWRSSQSSGGAGSSTGPRLPAQLRFPLGAEAADRAIGKCCAVDGKQLGEFASSSGLRRSG
jgi:hypothetical protein